MSDKIVSIFGTSRTEAGKPIYELAFKCGKALAAAGFTIANGGYNGTMLASAQGAACEKGQVIGVTCSLFKRSTANPYITREIRTDSLEERIDTLVKLGEAYVVLPGGTGTLLELAMVWELKNKHFPNAQKPIIIAGNFWKPLMDLITTDDPGCISSIMIVEEPQKIVEILCRNL